MDILGIGPVEMLVILGVALIIFGPGKLPEIANTVGKVIREFRSATGDLTGEFERAFGDLNGTVQQVVNPDPAAAPPRADQAATPASAPASYVPTAPPMSYAPAVARRMPTKDDPLADLMPLDASPSAPTNGHSSDTEAIGRTLI
ncbi:MAG TPA: twin-arginine translocase TatA/TatE family subunit [Thermomicrobiaceae bacterium]|nr:twin-arginine translocase TatA/TatE family subunit [Thermomicrobiaceae bacterium]